MITIHLKRNPFYYCMLIWHYVPTLAECGVQDGNFITRSRVVGGSVTQPVEFPWVVALVKKTSSRPFCAGTLISDRYGMECKRTNCTLIRIQIQIPCITDLHLFSCLFTSNHCCTLCNTVSLVYNYLSCIFALFHNL